MVDVDGTQGSEDFAALFEQSLREDEVCEGDIVRGTVIHVTGDFAIIDIGYKSEGQVPLDEFRGADGQVCAFSRKRRPIASRSGTRSQAP